jgi:hypothetical protein
MVFGLKKQFSSQYLGRQTKFTLYKMPFRPVCTYVSESWSLKRKMKICVEIFEGRTLRRNYGQIKENGV